MKEDRETETDEGTRKRNLTSAARTPTAADRDVDKRRTRAVRKKGKVRRGDVGEKKGTGKRFGVEVLWNP